MDGSIAAALFFIIGIGGTVGLIYYYYHTRHKERMFLIEKDAEAKLFQEEPKKRNYFFTVILGILFVSLALGILLGFIFSNLAYKWGWIRVDDNPVVYFMGVFLMLGLGFLASFFAERKLNK